MKTAISNLVSRYEGGSLSRRELIQGLTLLAASVAGTAQEASAAAPFQVTSFAHASLQVKDLDASVKFYRDVLGLVAEDKIVNPPGEFRFKVGAGTLVLRHVEPYGVVDHVAYVAQHFDRSAMIETLKQQGIEAFDTHGPFAFYFRDPDGYPVQIVSPQTPA
jgi:catechol 2,3-dioxygenase-like lactoylglutathione lyase family enzyme